MDSPRFLILLPLLFLLLLLSPIALSIYVVAQQLPQRTSHDITVVGSVFCDVCHNNSFTKHSYFLPGVDVHVQCRFEARTPTTTEQITFSVNRTTDRYGIYKLDIPSVDGVDCVQGPTTHSFCQATLIRSSCAGCNVPAVSTTSRQLTVKSKQTNLCVFSVSALSYRTSKRNSTLCGNHNYDKKEEQELLSDSIDSSKFFLPYFPPYIFPWPLPSFPPLPPLPQLPPFPPFPSFPPLPPLPQLPPFPPFPPFQFPPIPPLPPNPFPTAPPQPPPPAFSLGDPRTWIPHAPPSPPPPPSSPFNPSDPRTWIPNNPFLITPPPPPTLNLRDPTTWIPNLHTSTPKSPQSLHP